MFQSTSSRRRLNAVEEREEGRTSVSRYESPEPRWFKSTCVLGIGGGISRTTRSRSVTESVRSVTRHNSSLTPIAGNVQYGYVAQW